MYIVNLAILIPAYQPDEKLTELVYKLAAMGFPILLIVNDGSGRECREVFEKCGLVTGCSVLPLKQNMGKGFALKTGMRRILDIDPHIAGCITVDADGRHLAEDIGRIREAFCENPSSLILGCRDFDEEQVPFKSRFGNRITRGLFRVITKKRVTDTQTGLRAIPAYAMRRFIELEGDRYEYEMGMLMEAAEMNMPIQEVPIQTVYLEQNRLSHFRPLADSVKVYQQLFRFWISSLLSSGVDLALFALLNSLFGSWGLFSSLFFATVVARILSSVINYQMNNRLVFKGREQDSRQAARYFTLCGAQMLCSWLLVEWMAALGFANVVILKIIADCFLFLISFVVQKRVVFRKVRPV